MSDNPNVELLRRSIRWRTAAGWVLVLILIWRYLAYPIANAVLVAYAYDPLPPLEPIEWTDALAIIGLPVGGAFADRMSPE